MRITEVKTYRVAGRGWPRYPWIEQGIPAGIRVSEGNRNALMSRRDLFIDAVTAAITE